MVGMSGKASEPRRGGQSSQHHKKTSGGGGGGAMGMMSGGSSNKTQVPAEALHVANILGDGQVYPDDLPQMIHQVLGMLPSCSEEEVYIALHDNDFDTNRTISALLEPNINSGGQVCTVLYTHYMYVHVCTNIYNILSSNISVLK